MDDSGVRRIALFAAVLSGFLTPFDLSAVNIALPTIASEFSMDALSLSWVSTAYLLASAVFLVPMGRMADITGRKRVFVTGLSVFTLASLLMVFSVSAPMVILLRVVQGLGGAMIFGTAVAILTSVTPPAGRGKALGIYTTAVYLGLSVGPFLGGMMTAMLGWRSIFLINVPLGVCTIALILSRLRGEWAESKGERFDAGGAVLYGISLVAIMYGFSSLPGITGALFLVLGTLMMLGFVYRQVRTPHPLLDMGLILRNRPFAFSNLAALLNYSATFAVTFFLSLYLQYTRGFSVETAGIILITQPLLQAVFSSPAGRLSDRIEPGKVASAGMALNAVGLLLLAFIGAETPIPYLIAALAILGIGFALFSSPNVNAIMSSVDRKCYGVATGTLGTMRLVGQMLSMGIAMMLFAVLIGRVEITPEYYPQFLAAVQLGFLIFAGICIVGIYPSLARGNVREEDRGVCKV